MSVIRGEGGDVTGEGGFLGFRFVDGAGRRLDGTPCDPAAGRRGEVLSVEEAFDLAARHPGRWLSPVIGRRGSLAPRPYRAGPPPDARAP